jgi:heat shock protein 4
VQPRQLIFSLIFSFLVLISSRSLVAFGPKQRAIGEAAKTQETSNFKNTLGSLKRLIGRTLDDPDVAVEKKFLNATLIDVDGTVGTEVRSFISPIKF